MQCEKVLFSCRCDPPHCGHIKTLIDLGKTFKEVVVIVLDHPEQRFPAMYRAQILCDILKNCKGNYDVRVNKTHFAKVTSAELVQYEPFVYASGNMECLKHIESLGHKILYTNRAYDYEASEDRKLRAIKDAIG